MTNENTVVVLAGGVGAAKFIEGLAHVVDQKNLKIIVNTGDDIELFGLKICPDLDIITYTLANLVDKEKGWGFAGESFNCLNILKKYYDTGWFNAGDKDLATHIFRTDLFNKGFSKAEITNIICQRLGVEAHLIPMCNEDVQTYITTPSKSMHFEEYFIKNQCKSEILKIEFKGIENAKPIEDVLTYIEMAKKIIICPSNPLVSINTILNVQGIKIALQKRKDKIIAISPIIQGAPLKGPADKMLKCVNLEVSSLGVANFYKDIIKYFVIDNLDSKLKPAIEQLDIIVHCYDTIMDNLNKKISLAKYVNNLLI